MEASGIRIEDEKCNACGQCLDVCGAEALHTKARVYTLEQLMAEIEKDRDFYKNSGGGLTLSGGEILSHADFTLAIAKECRKRGISVAADTSGFGKYEDLKAIADEAEVILYDLKHMDRQKHIELTGQDPERIWKNLIRLTEEGMGEKVIIRVPFIHQVNDDQENVQRLLKFMLKYGLKHVDFFPYHNMGISKARELGLIQKEYEAPPEAYLEDVRNMFVKNGIMTE